MPSTSAPRSSTPVEIIATQAPRRSFPLRSPSNGYFTGRLYDELVLFLHKHHIGFRTIECVYRGTERSQARQQKPTICISTYSDPEEAKKLFEADRNCRKLGVGGLIGEIPEEIGSVEFVRYYVDSSGDQGLEKLDGAEEGEAYGKGERNRWA
ncbi:hypothetical protein RUND412_001985 [Rhizina undulata]